MYDYLVALSANTPRQCTSSAEHLDDKILDDLFSRNNYGYIQLYKSGIAALFNGLLLIRVFDSIINRHFDLPFAYLGQTTDSGKCKIENHYNLPRVRDAPKSDAMSEDGDADTPSQPLLPARWIA